MLLPKDNKHDYFIGVSETGKLTFINMTIWELAKRCAIISLA